LSFQLLNVLFRCFSLRSHSANTPVQDSSTWVSGDAFCLVRLGNTLAYPVTTSYGWSNDGTSYPTQCSKSAASVAGTPAKYYCNKFDINVGLIYYPVANQNTSFVWTYRPTTSPTPNPSPRAGEPTTKPTAAPTIRPSNKPTPGPTPIPGAPTAVPSTARPTRDPTMMPTAKPSRNPTATPTAARRRLGKRVAVKSADKETAGYYDDSGAGGYGGDDYAGGGGGDYGGGDDDDGGAADDQYATTGVGTYASPYYANSATDDFTPLIPYVVDNGNIFAFGKVSLPTLHLCGCHLKVSLYGVCEKLV
jgi:hypothetical protein